jgi:ribosomal protection tetracycline resistance protein
MNESMPLNLGILAHVDAGKTTLTEWMLHRSGAIRSPGSVDRGTARTDDLEVERRRGISVRSALVSLTWRGRRINLIDTPGHADFSAEVERSLRALDGAVLLLSAAEGVQARTEVLWEALREMGLPTILFVNKVDRVGADAARTLDRIRAILTPAAAPLQRVVGEGGDSPALVPLRALPPEDPLRERFLEILAEADEEILERYLEGNLPGMGVLEERFAGLARAGKVFPVYFGAALRGLGVEELMDGILRHLPPASGDPEASPSGLVFRVIHDGTNGRGAYVRLFEGTLRARDAVVPGGRGAEEKIARIRSAGPAHPEDLPALSAGEAGLLWGLRTVRAGDPLGDPSRLPSPRRLEEPLFRVRVRPEIEADLPRLLEALEELAAEDPFLGLRRDRDRREMHLDILGPMQVEILATLLADRYGLSARFERPAAIYRETPTAAAEGFVEYTLPKPCWAVLRFLVEPGPRGSGVAYSSRVSQDDVRLKYQREVERTLPKALEQGPRGWEVTDLRITLLEGEDHEIHSRPSDFVVATPMGIMDALDRAGTALLEPTLRFVLSAPEDLGGTVLGDLLRMRAEFDPPTVSEGTFRVEGRIPAEASAEYALRLGSLSGGRGRFSTRFDGYRECPPETEATAPRRSVDPRDRAKYILAARNALG